MSELIRVGERFGRKSAEPDDFKTLILMDSQGKGPCSRPGAFSLPSGAVVFSVNGGGLRCIKAALKQRLGASAKYVVVGGMGANDLAALGEEFEAPPRVAAVEGPVGAQHVVLEEEPLHIQSRKISAQPWTSTRATLLADLHHNLEMGHL